ncbi:MAG: pilus assembly FimT family protein [Pontibacterium sp.]
MTAKVRASLIEIAIALSILSLFVALASPRFLHQGRDARVSSLKDLQRAIQGAAIIYAGKARMNKTESLAEGVAVQGALLIATAYGAPAASPAGIGTAVEADWAADLSARFVYRSQGDAFYVSPSYLFNATPNVRAIIASDCYLVYRQRTKQRAFATFIAADKGC